MFLKATTKKHFFAEFKTPLVVENKNFKGTVKYCNLLLLLKEILN